MKRCVLARRTCQLPPCTGAAPGTPMLPDSVHPPVVKHWLLPLHCHVGSSYGIGGARSTGQMQVFLFLYEGSQEGRGGEVNPGPRVLGQDAP